MAHYCPNFRLKITKIKQIKSNSLFALCFSLFNSFGLAAYSQEKKPDTTRKTLTDSVFQLNEVQVSTGIQYIPKERATGSFVLVDSTLFNRSFSIDVTSRLEGVVSGLRFNRQDMNPKNVDLTIRSTSTIRSDDQPLIILDNFEYNGDLKNINPNDVLQVSVLKDAAAASIWGARAGNGVIVITTKQGKYNQPTRVSLSSNLATKGKQNPFNTPWLSTSDYIDMETYLFKQGYYTSALGNISKPPVSPIVWLLNERKKGLISAADSAAAIDQYRGIDARNDFRQYYFQRSISQQHALSLTGGGAFNQYYASVGWDKNQGGTVGSAYDRLSLSFNHSIGFFDNKLEVKTGIIYTKTQDQLNDPYPAITYPYAQLADAEGNSLSIARYNPGFLDTIGQGRLLDWGYRPLEELALADNTVKTSDLKVNLNIGYRLFEWLKVKALYQYGDGQTTTRNYQSQETFYTRDLINQFSSIASNGQVSRPIPLGGIVDLKNTHYIAQHLRGQLDLQHRWQAHELQGLIGAELSNLNTQANGSRFYGYNEGQTSSSNVDAVNAYTSMVTGRKNIRIANGQSLRYLTDRFLSFYANASYSYMKRYTLSGSMRKDGSNLFGVATNQKWSPLWSTGFKWDISKEPIYQISWLPSLSIRLSYGTSGNINKTVSAYLVARSLGSNNYGLPILNISNPPNPDLTWETVATLNAALDFSVLQSGRISGSLEFYQRKGRNLMADAELPAASGLLTYRGNTASMSGKGVDLSFNSQNLVGALHWQTAVLYSYTTNRVTEYRVTPTNNSSYLSGAYQVGKSLDGFYVYRWAGLDPQNGNPRGYLNGQVSEDYAAMVNSTDLSDLHYVDSHRPVHYGSIRNTVGWQHISLSFNVTFKIGYYFGNSLLNYSNLYGGSFTGGAADFPMRWQKPGDEAHTQVPSLVYPAVSSRDNFYNNSEAIVEKGDHIRFQDIRLAYEIIKKTATWLPFRNLQFFAMAANVGLIWKATKSRMDPDYGYQYTQTRFSGGIKIEL